MRGNLLPRLALLVLGTTLPLASPLGAQDTTRAAPEGESEQGAATLDTARTAYSTLRIRLSAVRNTNREPLHDFWRPQTGAGLAITTPFHLGTVGLSLIYLPFTARDAARPSFRALLIGVDWGLRLPLPPRLHARLALRAGDFVMLIDNPDLWLDSESELFIGGELAAGVTLWRNVAITATGSFVRAHTSPPLDLAFVTLGLEYAARTPRWLRTVLE